MRLNACYNRLDVSRSNTLLVQDGWHYQDNGWGRLDEGTKHMRHIKNVFKDSQCPIDLPECGDCKWRKNDA